MTPLEQILRNMQTEIDSLKRDVRELKSENQKMRSQIGHRNTDMQFVSNR